MAMMLLTAQTYLTSIVCVLVKFPYIGPLAFFCNFIQEPFAGFLFLFPNVVNYDLFRAKNITLRTKNWI